jgi:hypothetical protein
MIIPNIFLVSFLLRVSLSLFLYLLYHKTRPGAIGKIDKISLFLLDLFVYFDYFGKTLNLSIC